MIKNTLTPTELKLSDFFYDLPEERIAQTPLEPRDSSRLLVCSNDGNLADRVFRDIVDYFNEGDVLVVNSSKVLPARLFAEKIRSDNSSEKGAMLEILLLERCNDRDDGEYWQAIVRPGKKAVVGKHFSLGNGLMIAEIVDVLESGNRIIRFDFDKSIYNFYQLLDQIGTMPLPPYITERLENKDRYQTVYADTLGSAAAPTAGLHFTPELLDELRRKGVKVVNVILHVGLGTFRPVKADTIDDHKMHSEYYELPKATADAINEAKKNGKRVFAAGTTSCRTLEGSFAKNGAVVADSGYTDIFIYPGKSFNVIDSLITNFHLPESTLIMLVCAKLGYDNTMNAYKHAVEERYRFFSFGDAMLIQ